MKLCRATSKRINPTPSRALGVICPRSQNSARFGAESKSMIRTGGIQCRRMRWTQCSERQIVTSNSRHCRRNNRCHHAHQSLEDIKLRLWCPTLLPDHRASSAVPDFPHDPRHRPRCSDPTQGRYPQLNLFPSWRARSPRKSRTACGCQEPDQRYRILVSELARPARSLSSRGVKVALCCRTDACDMGTLPQTDRGAV